MPKNIENKRVYSTLKTPKEKITISSADFQQFYDSTVEKLGELLNKKGVSCKRNAIWLKTEDNTLRRPYYLLIICQELSFDITSNEIKNAFCDSNGNFVNLNYMYTLKSKSYIFPTIDILKNRADIFAKFLGYLNVVDFLNKKPTIETIEEQAIYTVNKFYENIAMKQFDKAWSFLSNDFQQRIWGKNDRKEDTIEENNIRRIAYFKQGYFFFRNLFNCHVFSVKKVSQIQVDCLVYYEAESELPIIKELDIITSLTINQAEEFITHVKKLLDIVVNHGGVEFEKRQINRLFHPAPIEFIWWTSGITPEILKKSYDVKTTVPAINYLFKCTCIKENDKWVIDRLLPRHC